MNEITVQEIKELMGDKDAAFLPAKVAWNGLREHNGKMKYTIKAEITGGRLQYREPWIDLWLTPAACDGTVEKLGKVFGWAGTLEQIESANFVGEECTVVAKVEEYNGEERVKFALGKPSGKKVSKEDFRAYLRGMGKDAPEPEKPQPVSTPTYQPKPMEEDSLPF